MKKKFIVFKIHSETPLEKYRYLGIFVESEVMSVVGVQDITSLSESLLKIVEGYPIEINGHLIVPQPIKEFRENLSSFKKK